MVPEPRHAAGRLVRVDGRRGGGQGDLDPSRVGNRRRADRTEAQDRAQEGACPSRRPGRGRGRRHRWRGSVRSSRRAPDDRPVRGEAHRDRAVDVGPINGRTGRSESLDRRLRGMPIRVAGPRRGDGDPWPDRRDERVGRRSPAAVVRDLEDVDGRQAGRQERRVDVLLDVAGQQEASVADGPEQDHRDVVDSRPAVGRLERDRAADGPAHLERDVVDGQPVAGGDDPVGRRRPARQGRDPGLVARAWAAHPRLEHPLDVITIEEQGQPRDVVLVRVRQDHDIDPPVPRGQPPIELDEQAIRVGAAVDEQSAAAGALDEDGVALPDVEDGEARDAARSTDRDGSEAADGHDEGQGRKADRTARAGRADRVDRRRIAARRGRSP